MALIIPAQHILNLNTNMDEVRRLIEIHAEVAGDGQGRKRGVEVLNKSGLVLLCACWEAYVEDLASAALTELVDRVPTHDHIPIRVLTSLSQSLKSNKDNRDAWELAADGWRAALKQHHQKRIAEFSTPKSDSVDALLSKTIGADHVSKSWYWKGMSAERARERLNELVTLRGSIAHRVTNTEKVGKRRVANAIEFIERLAVRSHNHIHKHLRKHTKGEVWPRYNYGSIQWRTS